MRDGPPLSGYYTTYPALDANGTAVFWRDSALLAVDADLQQRELFTMADDRAVMSRILLLGRGFLAFALDHELLLFHDTGLAPLAGGPRDLVVQTGAAASSWARSAKTVTRLGK
jgi:hypothetical protein